MRKLRGIIACEESQTVCKAFRERGFETWSCDILPASGGHPEWHIQRDFIDIYEDVEERIDFIIAFPPCTHLASSGAQWFEEKKKDGRQQDGIDFFMLFAEMNVKYKAIENPVGIMSTVYRKPDQIVQPYWFGDEVRKTTCLWLYNLPPLEPTNMVGQGEDYFWTDKKTGKQKRQPKWYAETGLKNINSPEERMKARSKTFPGIANAMADQWSKHILKMEGLLWQ
jgi:hypothetical protein